MKKLFALLLALTMLLCLAACGGGEKTPADPSQVTGETYNAGKVSVLVPNGWKAFPVTDMWSEDPNATDPHKVNIIKGGDSELDMLSCPYIMVIHYEPGSFIVPTSDFYDNVTNLDPITTGSLTWEGFSADSFGTQIINMWATNAAGHHFQLNIFPKASKGEIALTDADVQALLASIANV